MRFGTCFIVFFFHHVQRGFAGFFVLGHPRLGVEAHAFAAFAGENADDVADRNPDFMCHAAETGGKMHPFIIDGETVRSGGADIQHDFVVAHILHRYAGVFVYPGHDVRGLLVVVTPFVNGAYEIRFGAGGNECLFPEKRQTDNSDYQFVLKINGAWLFRPG